MSDYLIHDSTLEDIADAIRAKTGGTSSITPQDMATEIASIQTGGGEDLLEKRITNTLTEYRNTKTFTVVQSAFAATTSLQNVFLPNCQVNSNAFLNATGLLTAVVATVQGWGFSGCSNLSIVDTKTNKLGQQAFTKCRKLTNVILRATTVVTNDNVNVFNNTPFANGGTGGTIYIPKSLYDHLGDGTALDYKAATNWSTIDGYGTITWAKIEGSYYETHYADGTVIS